MALIHHWDASVASSLTLRDDAGTKYVEQWDDSKQVDTIFADGAFLTEASEWSSSSSSSSSSF